MKRQIRHGIFETNSSSTHSISIRNDGFLYESAIGVVTFGEFGWGVDSSNEPREKLSYVLTYIQYLYSYNSNPDIFELFERGLSEYKLEEQTKNLLLWIESDKHVKWLHEMVKEYIGEDFEIELLKDNYSPFGYIDHQSVGALGWYGLWSEDEVEFKSLMKQFIFNDGYKLHIDNDNH